jgi:hypothetical protein
VLRAFFIRTSISIRPAVTREIGFLAVAFLSTMCAAGAWAQANPPAPAQQYQATVDEADRLLAAGDAFEAVRKYEQAGRIAYNNKLQTDQVGLTAKLAAARTARDNKASAAAAPVAAPTPAPPDDCALRGETLES